MAARSLIATQDSINQINRALTDKGWSREDLAAHCGCSRQPAIYFGSGKPVSKKLFVSFCKALGLEWEEIAGLKTIEAITDSKQPEPDVISQPQNSEEVHVVKQIVVSLRTQIKSLFKLRECFSANNENRLYHANKLNEFFEISSSYILKIKNNLINESVIHQIGLFDLDELDFIADYCESLTSFLLKIELYIGDYKDLDSNSSYFELGLSPNGPYVGYLSKKLEVLESYARLQIVILCKKLINDTELSDRFNKYKDEVIEYYGIIKSRREIWQRDFEFDYWLKDTEKWFKQFELHNELEESYQREKPIFEKMKSGL